MTFRPTACLRLGAALLLGGVLCACNQGVSTADAHAAATPPAPVLRRQGQVIEVPAGSPLLARLQEIGRAHV